MHLLQSLCGWLIDSQGTMRLLEILLFTKHDFQSHWRSKSTKFYLKTGIMRSFLAYFQQQLRWPRVTVSVCSSALYLTNTDLLGLSWLTLTDFQHISVYSVDNDSNQLRLFICKTVSRLIELNWENSIWFLFSWAEKTNFVVSTKRFGEFKQRLSTEFS